MSQDVEPYADVKEAAERLTKARLAVNSNNVQENDLRIEPVVQAVTPNDNEAKKANTGGVEVSGSPESFSGATSDGFNDGALEDAATAEAKSGKASKVAK